jgi:hypothetical protein
MTKLPNDLTPSERAYCLSLDVAELDPGNPPQELLDIASRYIKWGLHQPNVKTGLLGIVEQEDHYEVFIRVLFLNVQWTVVKNGYESLEDAVEAWLSISNNLGCPAKIQDRQWHLYQAQAVAA